MEERAIPYILHSECYGRCQANEIFKRFMIEESRVSLKLICTLLESWKVRGKSQEILDSLKIGKEDLVELVDRCLSVCERTGEQFLLPAAKLLSSLDYQGEFGSAVQTMEKIQCGLRALETLRYESAIWQLI